MLGEPSEFTLHLEDQETGRSHVGRITGAAIARDEGQDVALYLTTDDRVISCAPVSTRL
jgi:hypothetical protein